MKQIIFLAVLCWCVAVFAQAVPPSSLDKSDALAERFDSVLAGISFSPPAGSVQQKSTDNPDAVAEFVNPEKQWDLLSLAVSLGGHVRVGYEDNSYMAPGELAKSNAVLVERMVKIAQNLGRDVATPKEARKIIGLARQ